MGIWRSVSEAAPKAGRSADLRANASAAAVLFGASVVAMRVAVRDVPPVSLAVLRFGRGALLLAGILLVFAPGSLRVLLGERRSGRFLFGFAAVLTGVLLVNWPGRQT